MRGVERLGEGAVKGRVKLTEGRPLDRNAVQQSRASIDSLYKNAGYYAAEVKALELPQQNGKIRVVFDVKEGERVAISQVVDRRQQALHRQVGRQAHGHQARGLLVVPEGRVRRGQGGAGRARATAALVRRPGLRRLPGHRTTACIADGSGGKAVLHLTVDEGQAYHVGTFDMEGNRRFSREELLIYYPVRSAVADRRPVRASGRSARPSGTGPPKRSRTSTPTTATSTPRSCRRRAGAPAATASRWWICAWTIREGSPATINKIEIVGNDVTHERVIREAIVHAPGRSLQPRPADPLVPERLQPRLLPAAACRRPT